ncbi:DHA2 family efflux MFS transporter permease subunit [Mesorhizobium shangrilense]|uniref:DHA2 family efflux MFS transporter permease subunit n=1 Tax=Mesorhizobium shangrilense TaxID=460060 RepID=A0ABV2D628_9HYPH
MSHQAAAGNEHSASARDWITVSAGLIGAFMAVLNIQITNASLLNIEGGIGTGVDNGAWISTSYLIGEIIVIPLCDYLSRVFSFRIFLLVNSVLFIAFSASCAFAQNLGQMIVLRGIQGFTGGVLIPMAFTLILTKLPKAQQPIGMAMFAVTATFAPAIGPTIGGYLTENFGWQYIFFINLVPGAIMVLVLSMTLERTPMRLDLLKQGDWLGIISMAIGLGALQTVLEEGNKDDWFGSTFIIKLALVALVFLTIFIVTELSVANPAVNLRLLARRNFGLGTLANALFGFGLFGSVFLLPQYLGQAQGYNAQQIGSVMAWTGLPQLIVIPFVPKLMKIFDTRLLVSFGLGLFGISCMMNMTMSPDTAGDQFFVPNVVRAVGQAFAMAPLTGIAMLGIAKEESAAASGLFNMLRNLGGAVGVAMLGTIFTRREQFHSNINGISINVFRQEVRDRIEQTTQYFMAHGVSDFDAARQKAIVALGRAVQKQSVIMGYSDTFVVLGATLFAAAFLVMLAKKGQSTGAVAH